MPVTQRWVHAGLILSVVVLSMCLTVLILGATRPILTDSGLPGSRAPDFYLKDASNQPYSLGRTPEKPTVLIFAGHDDRQFSGCADLVNRLVGDYEKDDSLRIAGIASIADPALFGPNSGSPSVMARSCPNLLVLNDSDGSVARSYRVNGSPVMFLVDTSGVIRGRVALAQEGAGITVAELLHSVQSPPKAYELRIADPRVRDED